jgi:predicted Zn-dependent peptidase
VKGQEQSVTKDNTPLPATLHAWRVPNETNADSYPLELLTNILATGRSSRLYKRLVEKEQAAMDIDAFPFLMEKGGMVGVFATGQAGVDLPTLDKLITEEIETAKKDGVTEQEYQKALNQKETEFANAFGTMNARAKNLARYHVFYGDTNLINTELQRYQAVKRDDLQRVAQKYLTPEGTFVLRYPVPAAPEAPAKTPSAK